MSTSEEINKFLDYNLIYIDFDNSINIVNRDVWERNNVFRLEGDNIIKIPVEKRFTKITQIHTGEYIFINENCNLCMCDSNFQNVKFFISLHTINIDLFIECKWAYITS
jgi:hypothetical protein